MNQVSTRLTDRELKLYEGYAKKKGMLPATLLRVALLEHLRIQGEVIPKVPGEDWGEPNSN